MTSDATSFSAAPAAPAPPALAPTPLTDLHRELGARMAPFAGALMPIHYRDGVLAEHLWTRRRAGLFDVSHMGQGAIYGADAAARLEALVPGDLQGLAPGRTRYTLLTNEHGGIADDLMVTRAADHLFVVVNAGNKHADFALLARHLGSDFAPLPERALIALQGPGAALAMAEFAAPAAALPFLAGAEMAVGGFACFVTRSGYTGEDGFEISVAAEAADNLARKLLAHPAVKPIGLGARDSLRLEAGLCLHGADITPDTTPVEADLAWTIGKRRRAAADFPGAAIILAQLRDGPARRRVGIRPHGRAPARAHTVVAAADGAVIGEITSGGFGPTCDGPIAMGYVATAHAAPGTPLTLSIRGRAHPAEVAALPFAPHRYHR